MCEVQLCVRIGKCEAGGNHCAVPLSAVALSGEQWYRKTMTVS
jgi:hypothetical protein